VITTGNNLSHFSSGHLRFTQRHEIEQTASQDPGDSQQGSGVQQKGFEGSAREVLALIISTTSQSASATQPTINRRNAKR
jgi:hypothetical protein